MHLYHALPLEYTHTNKQKRSQHEQLWGVIVCKNKWGSVSVRRDDLLTLQSFTPWSLFPNTYLTFNWKDHSWLAYTPKQFRNKAYSHKETKCKDLWDEWGPDNSEVLFIAYLDDVCKKLMKSMRNRSQTTHSENYLRQFEGVMEDYEAVSVALPPPLSVIWFHRISYPFHLILIFLMRMRVASYASIMRN